ncbi:hypothetical protein V496_02394 [Pseudogymnoascus sp. VKM F-4515 (FW-2607)]|nr:hypothetical protein V496_02394 [Pseudogymnoascus sp. VKM F-4515 (FW-2607)]KFY99653.1 hypothetical protein V498_00605 [Pseudogymnoascus sp. VKM F-4517 (FW-2822)]
MTVLTMMDRDILISVIKGTLPRRAKTNLARAVRNEQKQLDTIPCIYVNYVVDKDGHHVTKKDIVFGRVIDYIFRPRDPKGLKYCENKKQEDEIQVFIDGMTEHLAGWRIGAGCEQPKHPQSSLDRNRKESWATIEAEASTAGIDSEESLLNGYIAACRDDIADKIERHVSLLDANIAARERYHLQLKRLRELTSKKADAPLQQ